MKGLPHIGPVGRVIWWNGFHWGMAVQTAVMMLAFLIGWFGYSLFG